LWVNRPRRQREIANPELREQLEQAIGANKVLLLMKGTPEEPRCGFSMRAVGILEQMGTEYGAIDVLPVLQPLREVTTEIADWGTFPQLYVDGELIGGADLMEEMFESGELATSLGVEQPATPPEQPATPQPDQPYQSKPMQIET
jgi:monothiol glutaredoxin